MEIAATPAGEQLYRRLGYETTSYGEETLPSGDVLPIAFMTKPARTPT